MSQGNNLLTDGFLALVFCLIALLLPLLLMRLITAKSGCADIYTGLTVSTAPLMKSVPLELVWSESDESPQKDK